MREVMNGEDMKIGLKGYIRDIRENEEKFT
jgi:hypothetical protein